MKLKRITSWALSLALILGIVFTGTPAYMEEESTDSGLELNKYLTQDEDGQLFVNLEAYATGKLTTKQKPADIVFVLDQSGSMEERMRSTIYMKYKDKSNEDFYNLRMNQYYGGNLYYKLDNKTYAKVGVDIKEKQGELRKLTYQYSGDYYNLVANGYKLYCKHGEEYAQVSLERRINLQTFYWQYTYTFPNGTKMTFEGSDPVNFGELGPLYVYEKEYDYEYFYQDTEGNRIDLGSSTGADGEAPVSLYEEKQRPQRLEAMQSSLESFADIVNEQAKGPDKQFGTDDDVQHRIAVVGFASGKEGECSSSVFGDKIYENTGLFIGANQHRYDSLRDEDPLYEQALQDMTTSTGQNNISASINALNASGATYPKYGLDMANKIFAANPSTDREKVIVFLSDGSPGYSGYEEAVAEDTIEHIKTSKRNGVTVYTIGIFPGADAQAPVEENPTEEAAKANKFMHRLSSNYKADGSLNPQQGYYLTTENAGDLTEIFENIAGQLNVSTKLDEKAEIRDVLSQYFQLPKGTSEDQIETYTYNYGVDEEGNVTWSPEGGTPTGAKVKASIVRENGEEKVCVTGFNYKDNWCGMENDHPRGKKLLVRFPVEANPEFLGGNNVPTNASAGIYESPEAPDGEPVDSFHRPGEGPTANVPIQLSSEGQDWNVYLYEDLNADGVKEKMQATSGEAILKLGEENFGLEDWQKDYVNISVQVKDSEGNVIPVENLPEDLTDLTEDKGYSVEWVVTPKDGPHTEFGTEATEQKTDANYKVNVFKPDMTFTDSTVWYGGDAPTNPDDYDQNNKRNILWLHGETKDSDVPGLAERRPELTLDYKPNPEAIVDGKIAMKEDIPVGVDVWLNKDGDSKGIKGYTTFHHEDCGQEGCSFTPSENYPFCLHVKTVELTVEKKGGKPGDPYVMNLLRNGEAYTQLTIVPEDNGEGRVVLKELPLGEYSLEEDQKWSWRYTGDNGNSVHLTPENPSGTATCTNTPDDDKWVNDYSDVITNTAGVPKK